MSFNTKLLSPQMEYLNNIVKNNQKEIFNWLDKYKKDLMPIYTSVDVRNAGFKIAPVDTNLFPAGFNNLSKQCHNIAVESMKSYISDNFKKANSIALIPENFSRNKNYFLNLKAILNIFTDAGYIVKILSPHISTKTNHEDLKPSPIYPALKNNGYLETNEGWKPDLIILNNDLTEGIPEALSNIKQPILPKPDQGWHKRRKFNHYQAYNKIVTNLCENFSLDPWLLTTFSKKCNKINFKKKEGLECLAEHTNELITKIKKKYAEYNIHEKPYVFIKSDQGTFGMGIITVADPQEILSVNKKTRHSINKIKGGIENVEVVIQEGVPTNLELENNPAESVLYSIGGKLIAKFYRFNESKSKFSNLNSKGMVLTESYQKYSLIDQLIGKICALAVLHE